MAQNINCMVKNIRSLQRDTFIDKMQIFFYFFFFIPESSYKCTRHSLNTFRSCFKTDYWYSDPQLSWRILSISCLKGWRQPSSSMHHKPELIANQSNKLQLISKPISNFSCSSCLHLLRGKMWDEGKWFLVNIYDFFFTLVTRMPL